MKSLLLGLALLGLGCGSIPIVHPTPVDPGDRWMCGDACEHLRTLGCEEGKPLQDGTSCEDFCETTQDSGHALRPSCVVTITKCAELDTKCSLTR